MKAHVATRVLVAASAVAPSSVGQYSPHKFLAFHDYTTRASGWRVAYVLTMPPLLGLFAALAPALIPLEPLRNGPTLAFYAHLCVMMIFVGWGSIVPVLTVARVPASVYSSREALVVSVLSAVLHTLMLSPLCRYWRFPVPFMWIVGASMWGVTMLLTHLLVLRSKCWRTPDLMHAAQTNQIGVTIELLQVFLYPAISILFDYVSEGYQVIITMAFPLLKYVLKQILQRTTRHLQDQHAVVVIAAIEVCSSMYQSIVLQTTPSKTAMAIIMALDVLQGLHAVRYMLDRHPVHGVSRRELVAGAMEILRREVPHGLPISPRMSGTVTTIVPLTSLPVVPHGTPPPPRSKQDQQTVDAALQLLHNAETIVLLEYFEVIVPMINCVFVAAAAHFPEAFYNLTITRFFHNPERLAAAVASTLLYSLLQGVSWIAMHVVLKYRYGLSATYLLGFVMERHREPIQAKMVAWLPIILHFMTAHYGTDFTFKFDFQSWDQW